MSDATKLPEERTFTKIIVCVSAGVFLFACAFVVLTAVKAVRSPYDITSNWFIAWGTWAGGLGTAAAFLIAAVSISVTGAHTRFDRREAARLREDEDMAQARLMAIYKVEGEHSLESLPTYRIENRSKDTFFDVTVPFVESPNGANNEVEHRTADLVDEDNRLHEFFPTGAELTPYRDHTEHEAWFTLVTVHTTDASRIHFEVEYTDANGRRWSQKLGGRIRRITTSEAVPIRPPDRFQPRQQVSRLTNIEAWRSGFTGLEPPETDAEYLEVIQAGTVKNWKRIARIVEVELRPNDIDNPPEGLIAVVTVRPVAPPFWTNHFHAELAKYGLHHGGGSSHYEQTDKFRLSPGIDPDDVDRLTELVDAAIDHANNTFEQTELAAARRALEI